MLEAVAQYNVGSIYDQKVGAQLVTNCILPEDRLYVRVAEGETAMPDHRKPKIPLAEHEWDRARGPRTCMWIFSNGTTGPAQYVWENERDIMERQLDDILWKSLRVLSPAGTCDFQPVCYNDDNSSKPSKENEAHNEFFRSLFEQLKRRRLTGSKLQSNLYGNNPS